jgi:hypothetical protein
MQTNAPLSRDESHTLCLSTPVSRYAVEPKFPLSAGNAARMAFVSSPAHQAWHALPDAMHLVTNKENHGACCYEHFLA